ncbi:uncharacterized protein LOC107607133 [Arachis ipaensis]|uniref:uncharacterized protein LOC107607133 n=1 Tax=Arachis ipaensis TaxID=130454 RepID=UPI0007AF8A2B|nr:uncharacterized protein LOC107607133 [Arachis ipaensis]
MKDELGALELNKTWSIVDCPTGINPIDCKWVYYVKRRPDGIVERYKAHVVVKGFTQIEKVDFLKMFSPVVKPTTIRLVLALASMKNWPLRQLDVNNAFLENVYTALPLSIASNRPNQYCK